MERKTESFVNIERHGENSRFRVDFSGIFKALLFTCLLLLFNMTLLVSLQRHTLKSKSASEKFLCNAGDRYCVVATMTLQKETAKSYDKNR